MIVYFAGSARDMKRDIHLYRRILNTIRSMGHIIARDWVETAWAQDGRQDPKNHIDLLDWSIVRESEVAIEGAELFIAEASHRSSFGVGYEVARALRASKPTLILVHEDAVNRSYATGIKDELLTYKKYNDTNLEKIVETFIKENTIKKKDLRFNFVIDRRIHNYLRQRSYKSGKTKAEVIRDLLLKDMESQD